MIAFAHMVMFFLSKTWSYLTQAKDDRNVEVENCGAVMETNETLSQGSARDDPLMSQPTKHAQSTTSVSPEFLHQLETRQVERIEQTASLQAKSTRPSDGTPVVHSVSTDVATTQDEEVRKERCLENMQAAWSETDRTTVASLLAEGLRNAENPFGFVLYLVQNSGDVTGNKKKADCLALVVIKEFDTWLQRHGKELQKANILLTPDTKLQALNVGSRLHPSIFESIVKIYKLAEEGNEFLLPYVNKLLRKHLYKEAANCVAKLNLQHCFSLKEIVLPLIYQDKANLAERYLHGCKDLQLSLVKVLDTYCEKGFDMDKVLEEAGIPGVRKEKLRARFISKLVGRMIKTYKIDPALCPNVMRMKSMAGVRFLLYKKYIEKTMVSESWDELMENAVSDNEWLQEQLIDHLVTYNDINAAAKWAKHFNVPTERLNGTVVGAMAAMEDTSNESLDDTTDSWTDEAQSSDFYQLSVPVESIQIIDSEEDLHRCAEILFKPDTIIGIDSEWRPAFGPVKKPVNVSLLQLATHDKVFILDMITLSDVVDESIMADFVKHLFTSTDVLKLGYGIDGDIKMLFKSYGGSKDLSSQLKRVVDIGTLVKDIQKVAPDLLQHEEESDLTNSVDDEDKKPVRKSEKSKGLSELVRMCLGKPLNKVERLSDWERRPLRQAQLHYAALDAHCLVELYQLIKRKTAEAGVDVNLEPPLPAKKERKSKKNKSDGGGHGNGRGGEATADEATSEETERPISLCTDAAYSPVPASEFSVVCDTMLQGLGRQLRCCGIDVRILDNSEDHDEAAKIALKEKRVILTAGAPYHTLKSQVAEGMCYNVQGCKAKDQVLEVLQKFNVQVKPNDIFSRCQVCNGRRYICIPVELMRNAVEERAKRKADEEATAGAIPAVAAVDVIDGTNKEYALSPSTDGEVGGEEEAKGQGAGVGEDGAGVYERGIDTGPGCLSTETAVESAGAREKQSPCHTLGRNDKDPVVTVTDEAGTEQEAPDAIPIEVTYGIIQSLLPDFTEVVSEDDDVTTGEFVAADRPARQPYHPATSTDVTRTLINTATWTLENGVPIQLETVPVGVLGNVDLFYLCAQCGKVFWEGKHYQRVFQQFSHVLNQEESSAAENSNSAPNLECKS